MEQEALPEAKTAAEVETALSADERSSLLSQLYIKNALFNDSQGTPQ